MNHHHILSRRKALGVSQAALAQKAGLARETVNRFERQGTDIGIEAFGRLLAALGLVMKIEASNEVVVKNWDQFEAGQRTRLLAELRLTSPPSAKPRRVPAQGTRPDQVRAPRGNNLKVLNWGRL